MEIKGKVKVVLPLQSGVSTKGEWKRQTIVVEYQDGNYTSMLAMDNVKKADEFAKLSIGDEGVFKCNTPTSREFNGKWYTSVTCWDWEVNSTIEQAEAEVAATEVEVTNDEPF